MQKNMTKGQEVKPSVEGDPEIIQMVELSDRDLKIIMKKTVPEDLMVKVDNMHERWGSSAKSWKLYQRTKLKFYK